MENKLTINEVKTVIGLLSRAIDAKIKEPFVGTVLSSNLFYSQIFKCPDPLDSITLTQLKMDYVNIIDRAIKNLGNSNRKAIAIFCEIQSLIADFTLKDDTQQLLNIQAQCKKYKDKLELFEEAYGDKYNEIVINDKKLKDLEDQLNQLIDEVKKVEIDEKFKNLLLYNLVNMQICIHKYSILGISSIKDEMNKLAGAILLNMGDTKNSTASEKNILKSILGFIKNANDVVKFGENINMIGQVVIPAFIQLIDDIIK